MRHDHRVAVITGGTGEIGLHVAKQLADAGARVHCLDLKVSPHESDHKAINVAGFHPVDVSEEDAVESVFCDILKREGTIDYMIYCAGVFSPCSVMELSAQQFSRTIRINLSGAFLCCRAAMRAMQARHFGRIVLLSSQIARLGANNAVHYGSSKGGLLGLVRGLAPELQQSGIRINAVSPGVVDTAMPRAHSTEEKLAEVARSIPLQRIARIEDVSAACLFLLSEDSACLNGQNLFVNGGAF